MSGAAYQTWTPVDRASLEWIKPNKLKVIRASRHATREFCQDCGSALTIIYSGQTNTIWLSAAAYDLTAWGRTEHCQSMHICVDSAPPWHLPHTWARDGLKRVKDVCEEADEGAEDSEEEDYQLQQALEMSRLEGDAFSSSSSKPFKPRFNPQLALLQEMTNCSLFEAEQALAVYGSADAAAEALLGSMASETVRSDAERPAKKAKTPESDQGQTNLPVWRGAVGQKLKSSSCIIDLE